MSAEPAAGRWRVVVLGLVVVLLDGFDTTALGVSLPALAHDWDLPGSAFTGALVAGNLGILGAYLAAGRVAARFGRRAVVVGGTAVFALGSAATALVSDVGALSVVRLVTGLGLGVVVPAAISLAADSAPARRRETAGVVVSLGLSAGPTVAGLAAGPLIAEYDWPALFRLGAVVPLVLLPVLWWGLPVAPVARRVDAGVRRLVEPGRPTAVLWVTAALVFATQGVLASWTPTLLADGYGFDAAEAPLGVAALGFGGLLGGAVFAVLTTRARVVDVAVGAAAAACLLIATVSWAVLGASAVLVLLGAVGFVLIAVVGTPPTAALSLYPPDARTAAVGWTIACGRVGAVLGPPAAGSALALGGTARQVVLLTALPPLVAVVLFAVLRRRIARPEAAAS
ncbi:MFS transporter [Actinosynnema sp. NPDC020468]|uniref:MFS transporter n=1 Tax=Actinosynnema sp. NPDC020468 TaxID=3154488 RepID=UPI0033D8DD09